MFALQSGVLIPPSAVKSLYDPDAYVGNRRTTARSLRRGLFNPHLLFAAPADTVNPYVDDPFWTTTNMPNDNMDIEGLFRFPGRASTNLNADMRRAGVGGI